MNYQNSIEPGENQGAEFFADIDDDRPVCMVNLMKYKKHAEYEDGRETNLSGREAYAIYGAEVAKLLAKRNAKPVFSGQLAGLLVGEVEELWDDIVIVQYPNKTAMLEMFTSSEYQEIHLHRAAGLAGQLNIEARVQQFPST